MDAQPNDETALERGLRELAQGRGPSVGRLLRAFEGSVEESADLQIFADRAASAPNSRNRQKAAAILAVIEDEINKLGSGGLHPRCLAALRAGFRLDPHAYRGEEYDWLSRRLDRARAYGDFGHGTGQDDVKSHWETGLKRLAINLDSRCDELAREPKDWIPYLRSSAPEGLVAIPSDAQQFFIEKVVATYTLKGRSLREAVTERLIRATANNVDEYVVRASAPLGGSRDRVQIRALLNCRAGPRRLVSDGKGETFYEVPMLLANRLLEGETCFFATQVRGQINEDPIVEIRVTSHGIAAGGLTLRIQFDSGYYPSAAWSYGDCDDAERLECPPDGHPRRLRPSTFGYLTHTFEDVCKPLSKYGIAWAWPE